MDGTRKKPMSSIKGVEKHLCTGNCGKRTTNPGKICTACLPRFEAARKATETARFLGTGIFKRELSSPRTYRGMSGNRRKIHQSKWSSQS